MHRPIPGLTREEPETAIHFTKEGQREGYARKVYNDEKAPCSWDMFPEGEQPGWDLHRAYSILWDRYEVRIHDQMIGPAGFRALAYTYPLVLSTAPAPAMCTRPLAHMFNTAKIWVRIQTTPHRANEITYNGNPTCPWYRASQLFGHIAHEFGHPVGDAIEGKKPINTTCDCHPKVVRLGRFGKWEKGVLTTDAYEEARYAVQQLQ